MKKFFCLIVVALITLMMCGCANKTALYASDFTSKMEENGYIVTDISANYSDYQLINSVLIAQNSDKTYQVEFYVLSDEETAIAMFNDNVKKFEQSKIGVSAESSVSLNNYSKYNLKSNGYYMVASRVDNTLIYVKTAENYKDNVDDILDKLGY